MPSTPVRQVLLAPDKFRSTATAEELRTALGQAAEDAGFDPIPCPIADGGEGLLDAMGGEPRFAEVTGPLGKKIEAEWRLFDDPKWGTTAVIEMARASGLALVSEPTADDPLLATTFGTGELMKVAVEAGAQTLVVGCGGSATTDGGSGAIEALGELVAKRNIRLLVACDVRTRFLDAAKVFGPQKGASPDQVILLTERLAKTAERYRHLYDVDVTEMEGGGAAGGLGGALAAIGGELVSGVSLVADHLGLDQLIADCEVVITGEGRLDETSLAGKVVGELISRCRGRTPLLVIAGSSVIELQRSAGDDIEVVSLVERYGEKIAFNQTIECTKEVALHYLEARAHRNAARATPSEGSNGGTTSSEQTDRMPLK